MGAGEIKHCYFNSFYVPSTKEELIRFITMKKGGNYRHLTKRSLYAIYYKLRKDERGQLC